jgi:GT2 family glycosyltransferase/glycosyltransferase involved in cell wall biosynthesis
MRVFWETVLEPLIELLDPKVVVEIGADLGANTDKLLGTTASGRVLHSIDPHPGFDVASLRRRHGEAFVFHAGFSLDVLPTIPGALDLVLIDGDHNWYTVVNELRLVDEHASKAGSTFPMVVLHDVGWPYGRRDLYYDPSTVPASHRQPCRKAGLILGQSELVEEGGLNPHLHHAIHEHGERNGVLTAVEDFLADTQQELELLTLPLWHGLGILYGPHHVAQNPALREFLAELTLPPLLHNLVRLAEDRTLQLLIENRERERALTRAKQRIGKLEDEERRAFRRTIDEIGARNQRLQGELAAMCRRLEDVSQRLAGTEQRLALQAEAFEAERRARERANRGVVRGLLGFAVRTADRAGALAWPHLERGVQRARSRLVDEPESDATSSVEETASEPTVDVIVCVYNALEDVRRCLESVFRRLTSYTRVIIVNDGSDEPTSAYLRSCASRHGDDVVLVEHPENRGYTRSVNTGMRASSADYVILLNSDTIVTPGWVQRIVACGESDPRIGIVGPLSNAASWQTVPVLLNEEGTFCINSLPEGHSVESLGAIVAASSARAYPRLPFINGFCFAVKRAVADAVGEFDAESFPRGYGEENDYCLRARAAGFTLAVADDAYVFHAKSKSFGHQDRLVLSEAGKRALEAKHGAGVVAPLVKDVRNSPELHRVRERVAEALTQQRGERILFLLPVAGGGGGCHSVVQEAAAMRQLGVDAKIAIRRQNLDRFLATYRGVPDHDTLFEPYSGDEILELAGGYSVVVATIFKSVALLRRIVLAHPAVLPAYYVQDYEPIFFDKGTAEHEEALASYTLVPGALLFAKTQWLVDVVRDRHGVHVEKVVPSLDHAVYRPVPRPAAPGLPVRICAMVRPSTPRRAAPRTMRVLKAIKERYGDLVSVHIFGSANDDPAFLPLANLLVGQNHGVLDREGVAAVLANNEIFVDLSDYQAFGRTGLEAMACGCAVVNPLEGGAAEYCVDGENSLLVDTTDEEACVAAIGRLVEDEGLRKRLAAEGQRTAQRYTPLRAAESELAVFRAGVAALREGKREAPIRMRALPALHNGQLAGSAFVRVLQPFRHASLAREVLFESTQVRDFLGRPAHRLCDVLLIQRDATHDVATTRKIIDACRDLGIRVVYEVDDLLLESRAVSSRMDPERAVRMRQVSTYLAERSDAVVVSSEPLAERYRELNERLWVVPNALDPSMWGLNDGDGARWAATGEGPVRIGFMGTFSHRADLDILTPVVERLAREYGPAVAFELLGGHRDDAHPFRRVALPKDQSYPSFVPWFRAHAKWDIGLIPLVDDDFNRAKSYIKWLEYSAQGIASVCSDIEPYQQVVRNGENGLLVPNDPDAWYRALKALIDDPQRRRTMARRAFDDVKANHTLASTAPAIANVLESLWDEPGQRASRFASATPLASLSAIDDEISHGAPELDGYQIFKRRMRKLRHDPKRFLVDSRFEVVRKLGQSDLL